MPRYRARVRTVDAIQYTGDNPDDILAFMGGEQQARVEPATLSGPGRGLTPGLRVRLLDAKLELRPTQWIVRHVFGVGGTRMAHMVMWNDAFVKQYEPDDDA